ncbi:MAG: DUF2798 domain-containing protein [Pseudomonadota bacterium]
MSRRLATPVFALLLSCVMSCLVSGVATYRAIGLPPGFWERWLVEAWLPSWAVAFPAAWLFAPLVRRMVEALVRE